MPDYKQLRQFLTNYAGGGVEDRRAIETFVECETHEALQSLRGELIGIKDGNFDQEIFGQLVGPHRASRHGSFEEWAKFLLIALAECKK